MRRIFLSCLALVCTAVPARAQALPPASDLASLGLFLRQMPKGGDLHHHYSGAVYAETYLDWAQRKQMRLDPKTLLLVKAKDSGISIDSLRTNTNLYRSVLMAWSDLDYGNHFHEQISPDLQFFATFGYFGSVSNDYLVDGLQEIKTRAVRENVLYVETMLKSVGYTLSDPSFDSAAATLVLPRDSVAFDQLLDGFQTKVRKDTAFPSRVKSFVHLVDSIHVGIDDSGFLMRFQTYVSRNSSPSVVYSGLLAAFFASANDPLVVGVNIVGPENGFVALRDERLHARMFRQLRKTFPQVHVAMHAGELRLGLVRPEDLGFHVRDAVFTSRAQRIGHGVDIAHEDAPREILKRMVDSGTCVEINLTSNEFILGVAGAAHPLNLYRQAGVPVTLSTDDPGVSRNDLSSEYLLLAGRYGLTYPEIKKISENAVTCSFLDPATKERLRELLRKRFAAFEKSIPPARKPPTRPSRKN